MRAAAITDSVSDLAAATEELHCSFIAALHLFLSRCCMSEVTDFEGPSSYLNQLPYSVVRLEATFSSFVQTFAGLLKLTDTSKLTRHARCVNGVTTWVAVHQF